MYDCIEYDANSIIQELDQAIKIFEDRAEPYLILGQFLNNQRMHTAAYDYLSRAKDLSYKNASSKYQLFVIKSSYGKYINDELSVSCYWLGKYQEGLDYLNEIIDDPDFSNVKKRLNTNLNYFKKALDKAD